MNGFMWLVAIVSDSAGYPYLPTIRNEIKPYEDNVRHGLSGSRILPL